MWSNNSKQLQLEIISSLVSQRKNDKEIASELTAKKQINLVYDEVFWEEEDIQKIREEHYFAPEGMKLCSECKSNIKEKALVCRFCKKELDTIGEYSQTEKIAVSQSAYQRFSILGLLISFSALLHIIFCEWGDRYVAGWKRQILDSDPYGTGVIFKLGGYDGYGLYADQLLSGNAMLGLALGVLLPVVLLGVAIYLYTGWQSDIKPILKNMGF